MPSANAPKAPWVAVCESPQTITVPGSVSPSSGPITWTMPCQRCPAPKHEMPEVLAVPAQRLHLRGAHGVGATDPVAVGRDVVVHRGHNQAGAAHRAVLEAKTLERLR